MTIKSAASLQVLVSGMGHRRRAVLAASKVLPSSCADRRCASIARHGLDLTGGTRRQWEWVAVVIFTTGIHLIEGARRLWISFETDIKNGDYTDRW